MSWIHGWTDFVMACWLAGFLGASGAGTFRAIGVVTSQIRARHLHRTALARWASVAPTDIHPDGGWKHDCGFFVQGGEGWIGPPGLCPGCQDDSGYLVVPGPPPPLGSA